MKTLKNITALLTILAIIFTVNLSASNINFADEAYINDIPFDTKEVYNKIMNERNPVQFDFEEEAYIDDIPFDTKCVTIQCFYQRAINVDFSFDEETYINDIPFDTHQNVLQIAYRTAIEEVYNFGEEDYIDDIPLEIYTAEKRIVSMELVLNKNCK